MEFLKEVTGGVIVFTDEPRELRAGGVVTVADCGGIGPADARFKEVCVCGRECTSGRRPTVVAVEPLPEAVALAVRELARVHEATKAARAAYAQANRDLLRAVRAAQAR